MENIKKPNLEFVLTEDLIEELGNRHEHWLFAGVKTNVKNKDDVSKAVELGADGIFVASGIVKADDPESVIREMVEPL